MRAVVSLALAGSVLTGLTACNFYSPQSTLLKYDPSDGVGGTVGPLSVRNALLVTSDGTRATLVVSVVNDTAKAQSLEVQYDSTDPEATNGRMTTRLLVSARSTMQVGHTGSQVVLENIDAPAGSLLPLYFQTGNSEGQELEVPVLDGTISTYTDLLPSPSPTPVPTPTPTPTLIETPAPTPVDPGTDTSTEEPTTTG